MGFRTAVPRYKRSCPGWCVYTIDGRHRSKSFRTRAETERYRGPLLQAVHAGERFDATAGEPESRRCRERLATSGRGAGLANSGRSGNRELGRRRPRPSRGSSRSLSSTVRRRRRVCASTCAPHCRPNPRAGAMLSWRSGWRRTACRSASLIERASPTSIAGSASSWTVRRWLRTPRTGSASSPAPRYNRQSTLAPLPRTRGHSALGRKHDERSPGPDGASTSARFQARPRWRQRSTRSSRRCC